MTRPEVKRNPAEVKIVTVAFAWVPRESNKAQLYRRLLVLCVRVGFLARRGGASPGGGLLPHADGNDERAALANGAALFRVRGPA